MKEHMDFEAGREIAMIGIRLLDDAYLAWIGAESEAEQALRAWSDQVSGRYPAAYQAYRAAIDREEAAAHDLERLNELIATCLEALVVAEARLDDSESEPIDGPVW